MKNYIIKLNLREYEQCVARANLNEGKKKQLSYDFHNKISSELQAVHGLPCWLRCTSNYLNSISQRAWVGNYKCVSPQCQASFKCSINRNQIEKTQIEVQIEAKQCTEHKVCVGKVRLAKEKREQVLLQIKATSIKRVINENIIMNFKKGTNGKKYFYIRKCILIRMILN
jgi:hypothetical protein